MEQKPGTKADEIHENLLQVIRDVKNELSNYEETDEMIGNDGKKEGYLIKSAKLINKIRLKEIIG